MTAPATGHHTVNRPVQQPHSPVAHRHCNESRQFGGAATKNSPSREGRGSSVIDCPQQSRLRRARRLRGPALGQGGGQLHDRLVDQPRIGVRRQPLGDHRRGPPRWRSRPRRCRTSSTAAFSAAAMRSIAICSRRFAAGFRLRRGGRGNPAGFRLRALRSAPWPRPVPPPGASRRRAAWPPPPAAAATLPPVRPAPCRHGRPASAPGPPTASSRRSRRR